MTMIKIYYYGMPVLVFAQTLVIGYMAVVLNKMRRRYGKDIRRQG